MKDLVYLHRQARGKVYLQRWAIRWSLGCVNPASWIPLDAGREFTEPRAHHIGQLCAMMVAQTVLSLTHFAIPSSLSLCRSPFYPNVEAEGANYCYGERGHYELVVRRASVGRLVCGRGRRRIIPRGLGALSQMKFRRCKSRHRQREMYTVQT